MKTFLCFIIFIMMSNVLFAQITDHKFETPKYPPKQFTEKMFYENIDFRDNINSSTSDSEYHFNSNALKFSVNSEQGSEEKNNDKCAQDLFHFYKMSTDENYKIIYERNKNLIDSIIHRNLNHQERSLITQYTIPIVVHVIHLGEAVGSGSNISDSQILSAIQGLNERFANTYGQGMGLNIEINFCLATRDPNGCSTTGINRVNGSGIPNYSTDGIQFDDGCGADEESIKDLSKWSSLNYYNIWVVHYICGNWGGYAYYPNGGPYDGTVIRADQMIYGFDVLTHEVGHGFNLNHTFNGDNAGNSCPPNSNCASEGDYICDTSPHKRGDCGSQNPCGNDPYWENTRHNHMSYCNPSQELKRFTSNQKDRMHATLQVYPRSELLNSDGCTTPTSIPSAAGTITGLATVCQGQNNVSYSVSIISNATSYAWTLPTGATGSSSTNSISVNYGTNAVSGNITVQGINGCGAGTISSKAITVNPLPSAAGTITGLATVCQGQNSVSYSVPNIANATSYAWTLPTGATGSSSTNSISVNYGTNAVSGNITVQGINACGAGVISSKAITVNTIPSAAGTITGLATVCQGQSSVSYSIPNIGNATSYVWTLPTGATGSSSTNSISVNYGTNAVSGNITVQGINACGAGTISSKAITVNPLPSAAGTITGLATVCQGQNSVSYSVPNIGNATSYVWTLPTGATGSSSTNSISVNYGTNAVSGNITVQGINACGAGTISSKAITVNPLPSAAGTITGLATVCQGQNSVSYSVPNIANATSYAWTLPTGATGSSSTNSISVNYGANAVSGNITVQGINACGAGVISSKAITVNTIPSAAGTITGLATVCQGQNSVSYSVPNIGNATSYVWTLPTGATGSSSTNSISVNYGTNAVSGNITVQGINACGAGTISSKAITVNPLPSAAGTITGLATVCQGQNSVSYSVPNIGNATSYVWTLPTGATGSSSTNSISVNYGTNAVSGNITVQGINACGAGVISSKAITVNTIPSAAGTITGLATVCQGQSSVSYSVPNIGNATSYVWTLPTGATGSSSTNSISVNYGTNAVSGNITVQGINACGAGTISSKAITVNTIPSAAGTITGLATVCQGQNSVSYSVPNIGNATSYVWTLPTGATGSSSTNSISVNYGTNAVSGNITVQGINACGAGAISSKAITVNPLPSAAGTITGLATVCQGQNSVSYSVPNIGNATSYVWTLPTGATGSSSTNSISVNYGTNAVSGNITVQGINACGAGVISSKAITVNTIPSAAGTITGLATVCQGQNSVSYSVPNIGNATSYVWTLPNGASGTSITNSITVDFSNSATSGEISVYGINSCGEGAESTKGITVNPLPSAAGTITGLATVCQGQNSVSYSVPSIGNATSYVWTLPNGASGISITNIITVDFSNSATSGEISVYGINSCGEGAESTKEITVNPLPSVAGTITGLATVCQGQNSVSYSVPSIGNATSYIWTLPTGATGSSTTNSISVNYGTSSVSGNITVQGINACGAGTISSKAITINTVPSAAGTITGLTTVCQGQNSVSYSVPSIGNATSYVWTLPTGATGSSTTNSISVNFGSSSVSGNITVQGINACGAGTISSKAITVNTVPSAAGTITGLATVCQSQNSVSYSVPNIGNATSYVWTLPTGANGSSSTNSISVNYGANAVSGNITVQGINACGAGTISSKAITVNTLPSAGGTITGLATVCQGQSSVIYSVPNIGNATSYVWTLPTGATGSSTTNSISVDYGTNAVSGNITVQGINACGAGTISNFEIIVFIKPPTPIITLNGNILHSDALNGNQWYNQNGIIINATNQDYTATVDGEYFNIVTLLGCKSEHSNIINVIVSNTYDTETNRKIEIYPNPVSQELFIELNNNFDIIFYEIFDFLGQVVLRGNIKEKATIQTSCFAPGVYVIKLKNGKNFEFRKIIKN